MAIAIIFLLGIGNFALHKAVMDSGHPMLGQVSWFASIKGRQIAFGLEFTVLLAALLLAAYGWSGLVWGYIIYTVLNGISGWLILTGRV